MTTTTAPAKPTLVPPPVDDFEQKIAKAKKFILATSPASVFLFDELVALLQVARAENGVTAGRVDDVVDYLDQEESLAEHAEDYVAEVSAFMLKALVLAKFIDGEKATWIGPPELAAEFAAIDEATNAFRLHVLETLSDEEEDDAKPEEPTQPGVKPPEAPSAPPSPATAPDDPDGDGLEDDDDDDDADDLGVLDGGPNG